MNKKGLIKNSIILIILAAAILTLIIIPNQTSAAIKTNQYFSGNYTCENFTDNVLWSALAPASGTTDAYFNWSIGNTCQGTKNCDIYSIYTYVRYVNAGKSNLAGNTSYSHMANRTESNVNPALATYTRYSAILPTVLLPGEMEGPRWDCGENNAINTCNTAGQGFNNLANNANYSVHLRAIGQTNNYRGLIDEWNVRYNWCWTPIIYNFNISQGYGGWGDNFTFSVNVSDPTDNVTAYLYKKQVVGAWQQVGTAKSCANCSKQGGGTIRWTTSFNCTDIGDLEFMVNASNTAGYKANASASGTTNECLDAGNDCTITIGKDNVNITHISGNGTSTPAVFRLRVYDLTRDDKSNISETLRIQFNVNDTDSSFRNAGYNLTNTTGDVGFSFLSGDFTPGAKTWMGEVDTVISTCYNYNRSANFTVTVSAGANAAPSYFNETVNGVTSGATAGWGEQWNFSVRVNDPEGGDVNISLQVNTTGIFQEISRQDCPACSGAARQFNFSYDNFTCANINSAAQYIFVINDNSSNTNTTVSRSFNIGKDDIIFEHVLGNNSISNRSAEQMDIFELRVYDIDNGTYVMNATNITFSVMRDAITWGSGVVNTTNASGSVKYSFNATCNPRYEVGFRNWKAELLSSSCYNDTTSSMYNLTIMGDIFLTSNKPDGTRNYTQEELVDFLGSSVDDCGTSLTLNTAAKEITFLAFNGSNYYDCNDTDSVDVIGANAYSCDWETTLATPKGWYNTSLNASKEFHYNVSINVNKSDGNNLFYMDVKRKFQSPLAIPNSSGWGYPNWNLSVIASSGDPSTQYNLSLYMGNSWPPTTVCNETSGGCYNQTAIDCSGCQDATTYWFRNFTYSDTETTIYYRFGMGSYYEDNFKSVYISKDNTNISYVAGNNTEVIRNQTSAMLRVRVYDMHASRFELIPSANVSFKLLNAGYGGEKLIGSNLTNASGYAELNFTFTECSGWQTGSQVWVAEIESAEPYYNRSISPNLTISLTLSGCNASIEVVEEQFYTPTGAFQNRNFTVNGTITAWISAADDVNATLNTTENGWTIFNQTQPLGGISSGIHKAVSWTVNPATFGIFNMSIYANSSNAGNNTGYSGYFTVYKEYPADTALGIPATISADSETILSWKCNASTYRIANLNLTLNTTGTKIRVYAYNGIEWKDILHSQYVNTFSTLNETRVPILKQQIFPNSTGSCLIKIKNTGTANVTVTGARIDAYYESDAKIQDIIAEVNNVETTGIETSEQLFNVSVKIFNDLPIEYTVNVQLNITDSSGSVVNSSINLNVVLAANASTVSNFTDINNSGWTQDDYQLIAYISGEQDDERAESFIFKNVSSGVRAGSNYMCNGTTEWLNVTVVHLFNDSVDYNASLELPDEWSYSGSQIISATTPGNYTVKFNITSGQTEGTLSMNATINYTIAGINKILKTSKNIENNNSIPIIEIVRETPKIIGRDTVFDAQLSVHNKGCAATTGTTIVKEIVSTGWTPANPSSLGEVTLQSSGTNLINNVVTWNLGTIGINRYAVLIYQVKSPNAYSQPGTLNSNATYNSTNSPRYIREDYPYKIQTLNYSEEAHLQFSLEAIQQGDFPWGETRSAQISKNYNYSLEVKNIGDGTATGWNVTLSVPFICNVSDATVNDGVWNESSRKIKWNLPEVAKYSTYNLNFTLNCTSEGKQVLIATGIKDTRNTTTYTNSSVVGCSGTSCSSTKSFTFSKPSDATYEKMSEIDFYINYSWQGFGLSLGEGYVNITDDNGIKRRVWQNFSYTSSSGKVWANYTIDSADQDKFAFGSRNIDVMSYADATHGENGNVTLEQIAYTWNTGKLFEEDENLFIKVKTYTYDPQNATPQLYINGTIKTTGGWGESFYFNLSVRDRFARNVTVYLWHKKTGAYTQVGNWTCVNCESWTEANFTYDYQGDQMGVWYYKFNATNPDGGYETAEYQYVIEEDDINADYFNFASNATVNRSQLSDFVINVFDVDNSSYPGYLVSEAAGKIYISRSNDPTSWDAPSGIYTNESGSLIRQMENSSSQWCHANYPLGQSYFYGGVSGATKYKNNMTANGSYSGIMPFMLVGNLYNFYLQPQNNNYTLGSAITLEGYVKDDCGVNRTLITGAATVIFNLSNGAYSTTQEVFFDSGTSTYRNTTYTLPAESPLGWYSVTMASNRTNHWNGTYTKENAFYYGTSLSLTGQNMTPYSGSSAGGGWGESPFYFRVNVTNNQTTNTTLWMWNSTAGWFLEYSETCTAPNCQNYNITANKTFSCGNIGNWVFRYNASDEMGKINNNLLNLSFAVERDDVIVEHYQGNNSYVNRSETQTGNSLILATRINDTDLGEYTVDVDNSLALFTNINNGTAWITESESVNESAYYLDFNPGCNYAPGSRNWNMTIKDASCHKNISSSNLIVNVVGDLKNNITNPGGNTNFTRGANILLRGYVLDDCLNNMTGLTTRYFNLTNGTATATENCTSLDEGTGYYNCTWNSTGKSTGYWNVTFYSGIASYNPGNASTGFYLSSAPIPSFTSVNPSSGGWGVANYTYSVNITGDADETINVSFWLRNATNDDAWKFITSTTCTSCSNTLVSFNRSYTQTDMKNWSFKFNTTDQHYNSVEIYGGGHVVGKDAINLSLYEGNNSYVNRSNGLTGNSTRLAVYVYDSDKLANSTSIIQDTFYSYITNRSNNWIEQSESINETGVYYYLDFNPTCNYSAAQQNWNMSVISDDYHNNASSLKFVVNVIGSLNASYISPTGLQVYERGASVTFIGNVTDDCGSLVEGVNVQYKINDTISEYFCNQTTGYYSVWQEGGGSYNCTWDSTGKDVSSYNVTMLASKAYHLDSSDSEENAFRIKSTSSLKSANVSVRSDGWSFERVFSVNVSENAGDNVTVSLYEEIPSGSGNWKQMGSSQIYNSTGLSQVLNWTSVYSCSNISTRRFKFNSSDMENNTYTTSISDYAYYSGGNDTFTIEKNNMRIEYVSGNESTSTINSPAVLVLRAYDIDNSTYDVNPVAYVSFNITKQGIGSAYSTMNTNSTNASGHVEYVFYSDLTFLTGKQNWIGYIDTSQSPSCYLFNFSEVYNLTTLSNQPSLSNEFATPVVGGWGDKRTFNVTVYDPNETADVYFYKAVDTGGPWTYLSQQNYGTSGVYENLTFNYFPTCSDLSGLAIKVWYFKFNATNAIGNNYSTTPTANKNFTLTKDYVSFEGIVGNESIANRNGSQTDLLQVRIRDANNTIVTGLNVTFYVTKERGTGSWDTGAGNLTNSSGDVVYSFNPGCSPRYEVGLQNWKAVVSGETCYQDNVTSDMLLTTMGDIQLSLEKPDGTRNYTQEEAVDFLGSSVDDCGTAITHNTTIKEIIFLASNGTSSFDCNDTAPVRTIGANAYACDWVTTLSTPENYYNTTMSAAKNYHYNFSINRTGNPGLFYLVIKKKLLTPLAIPNSSGWGYPNWNFSVIA
ncbi:MAG: hypothetical protein ABH840_03105, partial [Nanoarchaeota archaeon]